MKNADMRARLAVRLRQASLNEAKKRFVQQGFTGGFLIRGRCKDGEPFACNYTVTLRESKEKEVADDGKPDNRGL